MSGQRRFRRRESESEDEMMEEDVCVDAEDDGTHEWMAGMHAGTTRDDGERVNAESSLIHWLLCCAGLAGSASCSTRLVLHCLRTLPLVVVCVCASKRRERHFPS